MSKPGRSLPSARLRAEIPSDDAMIADALHMIRATNADRARAQRYFFMWSLILATYDGTIPADIFARMLNSAPPSFSQRQLVTQLQQAMLEESVA